jgi:hypothetical protein
MPRKEKVLEIKIKDKGISSLYIPSQTMENLNSIKIIPEEPAYKAIDRMINFYKESNGNKK